MACPPAEMDTERRFLELLQSVTRVTPGENGQLRLMAGDEQAMVLDRAD
jgi:heat shock protein HslJ